MSSNKRQKKRNSNNVFLRCLTDDDGFVKGRIYLGEALDEGSKYVGVHLGDDTYDSQITGWETAKPQVGDRLQGGGIICGIEPDPVLEPKLRIQLHDTRSGTRDWTVIHPRNICFMVDTDPDWSLAHSVESVGLQNQDKDLGQLLIDDKHQRLAAERQRVHEADIAESEKMAAELNKPSPVMASDSERDVNTFSLREEIRADEKTLNAKKEKLSRLIQGR